MHAAIVNHHTCLESAIIGFDPCDSSIRQSAISLEKTPTESLSCKPDGTFRQLSILKYWVKVTRFFGVIFAHRFSSKMMRHGVFVAKRLNGCYWKFEKSV